MHTASIWGDEPFLEMDGSDGFTAVCKHLTAQKCIFRKGYTVNFMVHVVGHHKRKNRRGLERELSRHIPCLASVRT